MFYPVRDTGAWTQLEYDGKGNIPKSIENDGSWGWLAGQEITGEFLGEMGRALHAFREALRVIEGSIAEGLPTRDA